MSNIRKRRILNIEEPRFDENQIILTGNFENEMQMLNMSGKMDDTYSNNQTTKVEFFHLKKKHKNKKNKNIKRNIL